jgi:aryl-alcohol dehydrogenase-like predicted oxidoreductase
MALPMSPRAQAGSSDPATLPPRVKNGEDRAVTVPLALGCMRLSTEPDRDETAGIAVLHAALDAGVTLLDTADAYCWTDDERGHNERLIARALSAWTGDRSAIVVATKGGLTRPGGRWVSNGRSGHLAAAVEASCTRQTRASRSRRAFARWPI